MSEELQDYTREDQYQDEQILIAKIEQIRTVLGTMVMMPTYEPNPQVIGSKVYAGTRQEPIILDDNRKVLETKLMELAKQL